MAEGAAVAANYTAGTVVLRSEQESTGSMTSELEKMQRREWPAWLIVVIWLGALAVAFAVDGALAGQIGRKDPAGNAIGVISKYGNLATVMRLPGDFRFTLIVAVLLAFLHPWKWKAGGLLCLSGITGGLIYSVLKWAVGRPRPEYNAPYEFDFFKEGLAGIVTADKLSFPSGHTILAFSTAACLALCLPRWRWAFYAGACVVAANRLLENSHYLADVVAAAGLGIVSRNLTVWLVSLFMKPRSTPAAEPQGVEVPRRAAPETRPPHEQEPVRAPE
jgi:membrane-associated phospholipid phosphatase